MSLSFASARTFFEGALEIGIRVKMPRTYHTWHQDALLYPARVSARINVEHKHHFFTGFHALAIFGMIYITFRRRTDINIQGLQNRQHHCTLYTFTVFHTVNLFKLL